MSIRSGRYRGTWLAAHALRTFSPPPPPPPRCALSVRALSLSLSSTACCSVCADRIDVGNVAALSPQSALGARRRRRPQDPSVPFQQAAICNASSFTLCRHIACAVGQLTFIHHCYSCCCCATALAVLHARFNTLSRSRPFVARSRRLPSSSVARAEVACCCSARRPNKFDGAVQALRMRMKCSHKYSLNRILGQSMGARSAGCRSS